MRRLLVAASVLAILGCGSDDKAPTTNVVTPTCGDGVCVAGEGCCQDCGCIAGFSCQPGGACASAGKSTITFDLTESCQVSNRVQVRFFDRANGLVWPGDISQVFVLLPGASGHYPLECTAGAQVCYGADSPEDGFFWGVDIDGRSSCAGCCGVCNGTSLQPISLTCTGA